MARRQVLPIQICRGFAVVFGIAYAIALGVYLTGEFGLLGQTRGPLAGIYLIPLGLPWNLAIDSLPEPTWPWLAAAAPLINLGLIVLLCRVLGSQSRAGRGASR